MNELIILGGFCGCFTIMCIVTDLIEHAIEQREQKKAACARPSTDSRDKYSTHIVHQTTEKSNRRTAK